MTKLVHYIWALLPLCLYLAALRAQWRRSLKLPGREYPGEYLKQAIYCTVALVAAIYVDLFLFDKIVAALGFKDLDMRVVGWLIYPAILTIAGTVQHTFFRKREDEQLAQRKQRQQDFRNGRQR